MTPASEPIQHERTIGSILQHLGRTHELVASQGLSRKLSHLIDLRVSQINACAHCVRMHNDDARKDGETNERLDLLSVWRHVSVFTPGEKAAFAWAEALTDLGRGTDYAPLRAELRLHYSDEEISLITACVSMINLWNRIQISKH